MRHVMLQANCVSAPLVADRTVMLQILLNALIARQLDPSTSLQELQRLLLLNEGNRGELGTLVEATGRSVCEGRGVRTVAASGAATSGVGNEAAVSSDTIAGWISRSVSVRGTEVGHPLRQGHLFRRMCCLRLSHCRKTWWQSLHVGRPFRLWRARSNSTASVLGAFWECSTDSCTLSRRYVL